MRTDDVWCCGEGIVVCGLLCRFLRDVVCHVEGIPNDHCSWKMACCRHKELLVNAIDLGTPNSARSAQATASHTSQGQIIFNPYVTLSLPNTVPTFIHLQPAHSHSSHSFFAHFRVRSHSMRRSFL